MSIAMCPPQPRPVPRRRPNRGWGRGIAIGHRVWQRPLDEATGLLTRLAGIVHP